MKQPVQTSFLSGWVSFSLRLALLCMTSAWGLADPVAKACGHHDYPPWNWEQDGKIVGACAEAASTLFGNAGLTLDLAFVGPWNRCQRQIEQGHIDINICSFRNPERENYSQFVETPMGFNEIALFTSTPPPITFSQWSDLKGKAIGVVRGVSMGKEFDEFLRQSTQLSSANTHAQLFRMLQYHRIDAMPFGRHSGRTYIQAMNLKGKISDLPTPALTGKLYFSMSKNSPYLSTLEKVNEQLQSPEYLPWLESLLAKYTTVYGDTHGIER